MGNDSETCSCDDAVVIGAVIGGRWENWFGTAVVDEVVREGREYGELLEGETPKLGGGNWQSPLLEGEMGKEGERG